MKNFVVCVIILLLGVLGPQQSLEFEPVWTLGLLLLLAFLAQQIATYLRLPALFGWIGAGLILGPSLLQTVQPGQFVSLQLVHWLYNRTSGLADLTLCRPRYFMGAFYHLATARQFPRSHGRNPG